MKKPVVLLIVLGGLVGFAFFYGKLRDKSLNSARLVGVKDRATLFTDLPSKDIRQVVIREGKSTVTLVVEGDKWVVNERENYPAAYEKLSKAVADIAGLKLLSKQTVGKSVLGEVGLLPPGEAGPESTGLQVELKDEKGEVLGSFVAGKSVESTGGASSGNFMGGAGQQRWIRNPKDGDTVWLTGESLYELQADPKAWLDKAFIDVQEIKPSRSRLQTLPTAGVLPARTCRILSFSPTRSRVKNWTRPRLTCSTVRFRRWSSMMC